MPIGKHWTTRCCILLGLMSMGAPIAYAQDQTTNAPKDAILILDASGSMWGQIDGTNKIVIAKDVVEGLVRSLPDDQRLGFVAYGHRKKGDCSDIETLANVGTPREDVIEKLRGLSPNGKTPLSKSVEHAAITLDYKKNAATVILVSDGLETCDADPCALARTLEQNGLDFTVHVVGFDVTEQERAGLQCIADETGGQFLAADNATELTDALTQVTVAEGTPEPQTESAQPVPSQLFLKATILSGGPQIQADLTWQVSPADGGDPVFTAETAYAETEILPGDYVAQAVWTGWRKDQPDGGTPKTGRLEFSVAPQQPKVITVPVDLGIPVTIQAPEQTAEGVGFDVTWTGPDSLGGYISVNALDDGPRDMIYFQTAQRARDTYRADKEKAGQTTSDLDTDGDDDFDQDDQAITQIGGPSVAGQYELRYILDTPRLILARKPIKVTDSTYTITAPAEAAVSSTIEIAWSGPKTDGDFLTLIEAGSNKVFQNGVTAKLVEGEPSKITAPATPGNYEIRYILANGYTLYPGMQHVVQASVPIKIVDVQAQVNGPATAIGGATIDITWDGPADEKSDDFISIVEPGATKYNRDSNAKLYDRTGAVNPAPIRVPAIEGDYEIAYVLSPGNRIISRTPIKIIRAKASISAPTTTKAGETVQVTYSGDAFKGDRILIMPADTPDNRMWQWGGNYGFFAKAGETEGIIAARLTKTPGDYEIRYVTGLQNQVLARAPITITP